ncbi:MAG: hypothetical protein ACTTJV_09850 [Ottowia sp.]
MSEISRPSLLLRSAAWRLLWAGAACAALAALLVWAVGPGR